MIKLLIFNSFSLNINAKFLFDTIIVNIFITPIGNAKEKEKKTDEAVCVKWL